MIHGYRITPQPDSAKAFSGEGSKNWGGRWNSKGTAIVYAASLRSLALLEVLVHMRGATGGGSAKRPYLIYEITFEEDLLEELDSSLPSGWNSEPPTSVSQSIGDAWVGAARTPVLSVPSVIVPEERNYILNPGHKCFPEIRIGSPKPCHFDPRML